MQNAQIANSGRELLIESYGQVARFHASWLRDNAWDLKTRAPGNGQRLLALRDIPANTTIGALEQNGSSLRVTFHPEEKVVDYDIGWLMSNAYDLPTRSDRGWMNSEVETWDGRLMDSVPEACFEDLH